MSESNITPAVKGQTDAEVIARVVTAWHHAFFELTRQRSPPTSDIDFDMPLSQYPSRVDLVMRRKDGPARDHEARFLRGLWPLLGKVALADFKSPTRGFRRTEFMRLVQYGWQYHALHYKELKGPGDLTLVLLVPHESKALHDELSHLEYKLKAVSPGYSRISGVLRYNSFVVFLDQVAEAERDEYVRIFTKNKDIRDAKARRFIQQWLIGVQQAMQDVKDMEGYDEMLQKFLASMPPEQRLAGMTPEEVMASYKAEELLASMSPEEIAQSLSDEKRTALAAWLAKQKKH